jgi:hypothetical protein
MFKLILYGEERRRDRLMEKETVEWLLSRYFDPFADYLESQSTAHHPDQSRLTFEILLGEKLDTNLNPFAAACAVLRRRFACAAERLGEPSPQQLKEIDEFVRRIRTIPRLRVAGTLKELVAQLIPRGHGQGPKPTISVSDFPRVIAAVDRVQHEHPEWKREAVYGEVAKEFKTGWRTIQNTYQQAKKVQA